MQYLSSVLVMALIANYVLYWETFASAWVSFLFHVSTSSYKRRARCITLESETKGFMFILISQKCDNLWIKRDEKVLLFRQGHSQDFDGTVEVGKKRA